MSHISAPPLLTFLRVYCIFNCVYVCLCVGMHVWVQLPAEARGVELELQVVVSHLMWELETEPGSPRRVEHALNCRIISPVLHYFVCIICIQISVYIICIQKAASHQG